VIAVSRVEQGVAEEAVAAALAAITKPS